MSTETLSWLIGEQPATKKLVEWENAGIRMATKCLVSEDSTIERALNDIIWRYNLTDEDIPRLQPLIENYLRAKERLRHTCSRWERKRSDTSPYELDYLLDREVMELTGVALAAEEYREAAGTLSEELQNAGYSDRIHPLKPTERTANLFNNTEIQ